MTRKTRPVSWIRPALKEFETSPEGARSICLAALTTAAEGGKTALQTRYNSPMNLGGPRVPEETDAGHQDAATRNRRAKRPLEENQGDVAMKSEKLELVRGSGNVFRDLRHANADVEQFKAVLGAEIIKALDRDHLTVRAAHDRTGIAAADFSRIRNADLGRFTVDRLMSVINRLGSRVEVKIRVHRLETVTPEARP
jgi:predicted XRE-type DNA-binding protein